MNEYKHKSRKKRVFFMNKIFFKLNSQRKVTALPLKKVHLSHSISPKER